MINRESRSPFLFLTFCVLGLCMCLMHFSSKKGSLRVSIGEPSFYVGGFLLALIFLFFLLKFFYFPLLIPLFKFVRSSYNYDHPPLLPHVCSFFLVPPDAPPLFLSLLYLVPYHGQSFKFSGVFHVN